LGRIRVRLLKGFDSLGLQICRALRYAQVLQTELMLHLAQPEDWHEITARAYNRNRSYRDDAYNATFYPWEKQAVDRFFPDPPARVLVGAAGGGRELAWLAGRGYDVAGFDPAVRLATDVARRVDRSRLLCCEVASYQALLDGITAIEAHAPYDAIVLGFGSLSHVALPKHREALLRKALSLCDKGPLLLSWLSNARSPAQLRVRAVLTRLGLARRPARDSYSAHEGFIHGFDYQEIFDLASAAGYRVAAYDDANDFPHAVLLPK